uniref:Uncharacterized protein n=1 Tax=Populus trichocarpa TaxID=3694 RepID=A0A2K2AHB5_POPTR
MKAFLLKKNEYTTEYYYYSPSNSASTDESISHYQAFPPKSLTNSTKQSEGQHNWLKLFPITSTMNCSQ